VFVLTFSTHLCKQFTDKLTRRTKFASEHGGTLYPLAYTFKVLEMHSRTVKVHVRAVPDVSVGVQREEHPNIRVEWGCGHEHKTCNISETVHDRTKVTMTE